MVGDVRALANFAVVNATFISMAPLAARGGGPVSEEDLGAIRNGALVAKDGCIAAIGPHAQCAPAIREARLSAGVDFLELDAGGKLVLPGFIDAHTHALFAGDRIPDFEALSAGREPPLGIAYTLERTRGLDVVALTGIGERHLAMMAAHGTTTAEVKSGYALCAAGECRMLAAIAALDQRPALPHAVATFCGAHALPPEFDDADAFIDELCARMLPQVAVQGIARFADAFCERGYFSPAQCKRFLQAGAAHGLGLRIHADELSHSGGAQVAAQLRCASADHLNFSDEQDIAALAAAGSVAVLCPATTEYLGLQRFAPARKLIDAGVPVALATDFNPGTSPCYSLQTVAHLARRRLQLSAAETLAGLTIWAARSLGSNAGKLSLGAPADLVLLDCRDVREFGYYYGGNAVATTILAMKKV